MTSDTEIININNKIILLEENIRRYSDFDTLTVNTLHDLQNRMTSIETKNDSFSKSDYISGLSFLLSLLTALCLVCYRSYKIYKEKEIKFRKFMTGNWTTEGDVTMSQPLPYLNFELEVDNDDGEITVVLNPRKDNYPMVLSINGILKFNKANIEITHFSRGRTIDYGKARLKLKGKLLVWKTIEGEKELYPEKVIAWKIPKISSNGGNSG